MLPSLSHLTLNESTGCLTYELDIQNKAVSHPSCDDTQLVILEGDNGEFSATNYIKLAGSLSFLCWPIENRHFDKIDDDNVFSPCSALEFDQVIAQDVHVTAPPRYRTLGGGDAEDNRMDFCPTKAVLRADGTIVFRADFSGYAGEYIDTIEVAKFLRERLVEELANKKYDVGNRATIQRAIDGMTSTGNNPDSLNEFLQTISICIRSQMSLVVGLFPKETETSSFVITFKGLKRDTQGRLDVPCLGLVHEDTTSPQPVDKSQLYEHLHAVRSSYWVAALINPSTKFGQLSIKHSAGQQSYNEITKEYDNNGLVDVETLSHRRTTPFASGVEVVSFVKSERIDGMYEEDGEAAERRAAATAILRDRFTSMAARTMWPDNQLPTGALSLSLHVTNMALARVGADPVASITLEASDAFKEDYRAKDVRSNLEKLQTEKNYIDALRRHTAQSPDAKRRRVGPWGFG